MNKLCIVVLLALSGCASNPSPHVPLPPVTIKVPVPFSCIDALPEKPRFHSDAELKAMNDFTIAITLLTERINREIYEARLETVLDGCR